MRKIEHWSGGELVAEETIDDLPVKDELDDDVLRLLQKQTLTTAELSKVVKLYAQKLGLS